MSVGRETELRLLLALAISAALHLSLIYGVAVGRLDAEPAHVIRARLQPAADGRQVGRITAMHAPAPGRFIDTTPEPRNRAALLSSALPEPSLAAAVASVRDESRAPAIEM